MQISAAHCREQEALQRANAAKETLENRRQIALKAAKAWEDEAVLAEKRESGSSTLDQIDVDIALEFEREAQSDLLSEETSSVDPIE